MATSTVNTNKPIIPRGVDDRPVDKYNRAELYSGKALDFDGVNDYVAISDNAALNFGTGDFSIAFVMKSDVAGFDRVLDKRDLTNGYTINIGPSKNIVLELNDGTGSSQFATSTIYADGKLKHVVISFDRSGNADFYINGAFDEGIDISSKSGNLDSTSDLFIGADAPSGTGIFYDGQLSGLKMYSTTLTAAQVADLYNNPEKVVPTGVSDSALKLWLPMQEGAGTTCINGAPDAIGSEMLTNGDFSDGSNDWTFGSAFSVVNGKAYYNDSASGNQIYQSNLTFDTSKNYLLTFDISDATDAVLWVGNSAGTNAYTIISNYNTYNNGHYYLLLRGSDIGASETTLAFWANPSGAAFSIDNISLKEVANCGTISGATWTHGIGAPVAQTSVIDWNKRKLEGEGTTNEYLIPQGLTSGRDLLGNLFENVRKQGALNLDGNSWAEVHDNASLDMITNITAEAWVYWRQTTGSTDSGILSRWASATGRQFLIYHQDDTNVKFYTGTAPSTYTLMTEGWHHIVGTYDGANRKLYVDGVLRDTDAYSAAMDSSDEPVEIGRYFHGAAFTTDDTIAQPRIYNRALTASEVLNNYNATSSLYI